MTQKFHCLIDHAIDQLGSDDQREDRIEKTHQKIERHRARVVRLRNNKTILHLKAKFQEINTKHDILSIKNNIQNEMRQKNLQHDLSLKNERAQQKKRVKTEVR